MDIQLINFEDIRNTFFHGTSAPEADKLARFDRRASGSVRLKHLLRHHQLQGVSDKNEIHLRDSFDSLLAFYSLLEIAILIDFVREPDTDEFWETVQLNLSHTDVRRYYEEHYPLYLPKLLRQRLDREITPKESKHSKTAVLFSAFLSLENRTSWDPDIDIFLRLLDYFYFGNVRLETLMSVLMKKEEFMRRILRAPQERDVLDMALQGFRKFLLFSQELDGLLQQSSEFPLLQSAMWHYHGYWFRAIGKQIESQIQKAVHHFLQWAPTRKEVREEIEASISEVKALMGRLVSGDYGKANFYV